MKVLLDTNILARLSDRAQLQFQMAHDAVDLLSLARHELVLFPQVLYEYWVVATRPQSSNGLGMDTTLVSQAVNGWISVFTLLRDEHRIFQVWHGLAQAYDVKGKNAHDARLVAAMHRHQVSHILTFNQPDFSRYSQIAAISPADILAGRLPA